MYQKLINSFYENRNYEKANGMKAYMKNQFDFLGIQKVQRSFLQKEFINDAKKTKVIDWNFVFKLWNLPEREFQYLAMDYIVLFKDGFLKEDIGYIKKLIIEKSWWDTVDLLSSKMVGALCTKYPELMDDMLEWSECDNMWLKRSSILFQLKYKEKTNDELLEMIILNNNEDNEFFIAKAIGWILREYSKTNPKWVKKFIEDNNLQKLSIREGSKYIG
ncbi:MAG: DNA alkylation repair protein [Bacillota bacterium]|nr:DNA alkylation repair protein [Bacillota bacterium]